MRHPFALYMAALAVTHAAPPPPPPQPAMYGPPGPAPLGYGNGQGMAGYMGAEMGGAGEVVMGVDEFGAIKPFRIWRRHHPHQPAGNFPGAQGPQFPVPQPPPQFPMAPPQDDDTSDLSGTDAQLSALEADDEDDGSDEDGAAVLGAIGGRLSHLKHHLAFLRDELRATHAHQFHRRTHLKKAIHRTEAAIQRKNQRHQQKLHNVARRLNIPPAVLYAQSHAGSSLHGEIANYEMLRAGALAGQFGVTNRSMPAGQENRVPLTSGGLPLVNFTIQAGGGLRTVPITMSTLAVTFATFRVKGLQVDIQIATGQNANGFPNSDILVNLLIADLTVQGDINLLLQTETVEMSAQGGSLIGSRTIPGLRKAAMMEINETAQVDMTLRQEISTAVAFNGTIKAAVVVDVVTDTKARAAG